MAKMSAEMVSEEFALGPLMVPVAAIATLGSESFSKNGVVLVGQSGRKQVTIMQNDKPVVYTVSLYVQREPVNDAEQIKVDAAAKEQASKKSAREQAAQDVRDREIKRATDLTRDILLDSRKLA